MDKNTNQQVWNQRNMNTNSQWNLINNNCSQSNQNDSANNYNNRSQNNNGINRNNNTNFDPFLGHWPTPSEDSRPMKMMLGKIMEEIAALPHYIAVDLSRRFINRPLLKTSDSALSPF